MVKPVTTCCFINSKVHITFYTLAHTNGVKSVHALRVWLKALTLHLNMKWHQLKLYLFPTLSNVNKAEDGRELKRHSTFVFWDGWWAVPISSPRKTPTGQVLFPANTIAYVFWYQCMYQWQFLNLTQLQQSINPTLFEFALQMWPDLQCGIICEFGTMKAITLPDLWCWIGCSKILSVNLYGEGLPGVWTER